MKRNLIFTMTSILFAVVLSSCSDDNVVNPPNPNDVEVITTLILNFTDTATGATSSFEFDDPDGAGGGAPVKFDTIRINSNTVYDVELVLLNRSVTPADTISNEVEEEGTDHQFFYVPENINTIVDYTDFDSNGNPLGLTSRWSTTGAGFGFMDIILKHQPGIKPPAPGDVTIGETDVDVNFNTVIN